MVPNRSYDTHIAARVKPLYHREAVALALGLLGTLVIAEFGYMAMLAILEFGADESTGSGSSRELIRTLGATTVRGGLGFAVFLLASMAVMPFVVTLVSSALLQQRRRRTSAAAKDVASARDERDALSDSHGAILGADTEFEFGRALPTLILVWMAFMLGVIQWLYVEHSGFSPLSSAEAVDVWELGRDEGHTSAAPSEPGTTSGSSHPEGAEVGLRTWALLWTVHGCLFSMLAVGAASYSATKSLEILVVSRLATPTAAAILLASICLLTAAVSLVHSHQIFDFGAVAKLRQSSLPGLGVLLQAHNVLRDVAIALLGTLAPDPASHSG